MLFDSLLPYRELKRHIVLMTGMGSDGAKGMLALKQAGALSTIAESSETCVVYGMPRAAVELNCVTHQLPLHQIAAKLTDLVTKDSNSKT
jgi:two-component system chemotaxis response regulator CheB